MPSKKTPQAPSAALILIEQLRLAAAAGDKAAISSLIEIGNAAASALEDAWPTPALDEVARTLHFVPVRHTNLPASYAPTGTWQAERIRAMQLASPPPHTPPRHDRADPVRDMADAFIARVHGVPFPVGIEHFIGVHPVADSVAKRLLESREIGKWADAFVEWAITTWPQSVAPKNKDTDKGGLLLEEAERRERQKRTFGLTEKTHLKQLAREIFRPVLK